MAVKIFPTVNDVGGGGAGKVITEDNLVKLIKMFLGQNFVLSGFTVPASSTTLNLDVAAGEANIAGYRVVIDTATTVTCTASVTNYIYLKLTRDASKNVTGATFEVNTTGTAPADSILIATAVTDASTVTSTTDKRILYPFSYSQLPYTPVNKAGDTMTGPLTVPNLIARINIPSSSPPSAWPVGFVAGIVYNNGYPVSYGTIFSYKGTSGNSCVQILQAWPGRDGGEAYLYIRSARDTGADVFGPWRKVWSENNDGAGSGLDADLWQGYTPINYPYYRVVKTDPTGVVIFSPNAIASNNTEVSVLAYDSGVWYKFPKQITVNTENIPFIRISAEFKFAYSVDILFKLVDTQSGVTYQSPKVTVSTAYSWVNGDFLVQQQGNRTFDVYVYILTTYGSANGNNFYNRGLIIYPNDTVLGRI